MNHYCVQSYSFFQTFSHLWRFFFVGKNNLAKKPNLWKTIQPFRTFFFRNILSIKKEKRTFASETTERLTQ